MTAPTSTQPLSVGPKKIWNVPNQITTARLVLSIVVFVLIGLHYYAWAAGAFIVAASTDWVDGYYARKYGLVTQVGRIFDPFVDKIIICGAFIFLAAEPGSGVWPWMAVVVMGREMLVTVLRSYIESQGGDFSATMPGKVKFLLQCIAVVASLVALWHRREYTGEELADWLRITLIASVWGAILSTIYSGVIYVLAAVRMMRTA